MSKWDYSEKEEKNSNHNLWCINQIKNLWKWKNKIEDKSGKTSKNYNKNSIRITSIHSLNLIILKIRLNNLGNKWDPLSKKKDKKLKPEDKITRMWPLRMISPMKRDKIIFKAKVKEWEEDSTKTKSISALWPHKKSESIWITEPNNSDPSLPPRDLRLSNSARIWTGKETNSETNGDRQSKRSTRKNRLF